MARLLALASILLACGVARARDTPRTFAITFHTIEGVTREHLDDRVARANQLFAPAGVAFTVGGVVPLDARHAVLTTREDRDALGAHRTPGTIDVFVVRGLVDVDTPPLPRRGVHWRDRTRRGVRYVIVVADASPWVLSHELGHYFGNPHSDVPGNLMSYTRAEGDPFLDAAQLGRVRRSAARLARAMRTR